MAQYTNLNRQDINQITADFGLKSVHSYKVLSGGSENTNYLLETGTGSYVLTICEQKKEKSAEELAHLLRHLENHEFTSSMIVQNIREKPFSLWKGKPVMLKHFVEGEILSELPHHLLALLGRELGKLHKIEALPYLPTQLSYGREQFGDVKKYAADSSFDRWIQEKLAYILPYFSPGLPRALIHSDVFADNVIVSKEEDAVTIVDFEEAAYYYRVFDLGMTIIGTCAEGEAVNPEKIASLLEGYAREVHLEEIEINALQAFTVYAGTAMTFWRHRNFNYVRPDPQLSDHYIGLQVLTDFIEGQDAQWLKKLIQ